MPSSAIAISIGFRDVTSAITHAKSRPTGSYTSNYLPLLCLRARLSARPLAYLPAPAQRFPSKRGGRIAPPQHYAEIGEERSPRLAQYMWISEFRSSIRVEEIGLGVSRGGPFLRRRRAKSAVHGAAYAMREALYANCAGIDVCADGPKWQ